MLRRSDWTGSIELHTIMEALSTLLAFTVGALALVRYYSKKDVLFLIIGTGFLGAGLLDGYHAVVSSSFFRSSMPSDLPSLIPWSWIASRQFLAVFMVLAWLSTSRGQHPRLRSWFSEHMIYGFSLTFTIVSFLFFTLVKLPQGYFDTTVFHRPEEFLPALLFGVAAIGIVSGGTWRTDMFAHWLLLSLITGFLGQAVFMSTSSSLFDFEFNAAHLIKSVSYLFVMVGLMVSMFGAFKSESALRMQLLEASNIAVDPETGYEALRKQLREKVSLIRSIHTTVVDGIIAIDSQGIVSAVNPAAERLFGYDADEIVGKNVKILMPQEYSTKHDQYLENYHQTGEAKIIGKGREVVGLRKDGLTFPMDLAVGEMKVGGQRYYTGVVRDITQRKQAELELLEMNKELQEFSYIASHDLKAPLRAIHNYADFLNEELSGQFDSDQKLYMKSLRDSVIESETLIEDLLKLSRLNNEALTQTNIPLRELVQELVQQPSVSGDCQISITGEWPVVKSTRTILKQALQNLISNGVKFNQSEQKLLTLNCRKIGSRHCEIEVRDNGIGINERHLERIFQTFQRLHTRTEFEGTGIGLAIVKKSVNKLGGTVRVESQIGHGSSFFLKFPLVARVVK